MGIRNIVHLENPISVMGIPSPLFLPIVAQSSLLRLTYFLPKDGSWSHPLIHTSISQREAIPGCKQR